MTAVKTMGDSAATALTAINPQAASSQQDTSMRRGSVGGFTLTELLIVITIIALLAGIVLTGGSALLRGAEERRTRMLLQQLAGAETEYRAQTGSTIEWDEEGEVDSIEHFVRRAWEVQETRALLENIEDQYLTYDADDDDRLGPPTGVVDAWGHRIEYRSSWGGGNDIRAHPRPFFASPGSSGEFGDRYDLYSFDFE